MSLGLKDRGDMKDKKDIIMNIVISEMRKLKIRKTIEFKQYRKLFKIIRLK